VTTAQAAWSVIAADCDNQGLARLALIAVPAAIIAAYVFVVREVARGHSGSNVVLIAVYVLGIGLGVGALVKDVGWAGPEIALLAITSAVGGSLIGALTEPRAPVRVAIMSALGTLAVTPGAGVLFFFILGVTGSGCTD